MKSNFWIKTDKKEDIDNFINISKEMGYEIRYEDMDNSIGIGIFSRMPDVKNTKFVNLICEVCFVDRLDGVNGKLIKNKNIDNKIRNFKSNLDDEVKDALKSLEKILKKYPKLKIGTKIISYLDIEYNFFDKPYKEKVKNIVSYTYSTVKPFWMIHTTTGYSEFDKIITLKDYELKIK